MRVLKVSVITYDGYIMMFLGGTEAVVDGSVERYIHRKHKCPLHRDSVDVCEVCY